ncbi:TPA: hypothetical protein EYP44_05735, partial [Candidatus Bathyarchaeota archaeon]|nr:hypothetical protein [Candidatus Bathyarchaeota archaeon]
MTEKKGFLKSRWSLLLNPTALRRIKLWDVDLSALLPGLLQGVEKYYGFPDFRLYGLALSSSSFIYLKKVNALLKLENPPSVQRRPNVWVPSPIPLPCRRGTPLMTVDHLLKALRVALEEAERNPSLHEDPEVALPEGYWSAIDSFLADVEAETALLYDRLVRLRGIISFSYLSRGLAKEEIIKNFLLLLFLAQQS